MSKKIIILMLFVNIIAFSLMNCIKADESELQTAKEVKWLAPWIVEVDGQVAILDGVEGFDENGKVIDPEGEFINNFIFLWWNTTENQEDLKYRVIGLDKIELYKDGVKINQKINQDLEFYR